MPPKIFRKYNKKSSGSSTVMSNNLTSAKYLIIVESPSKCAKIESYLGESYCCIASRGHLRSIDGLKSIDTKGSFKPTFSIISEKSDHIEAMRGIISRFSPQNILLATDDDREGEAISWHICELFGLSVEETKRILFHEVTKPALIAAVNNPTKINQKLVNAQQARQVLDMIVGYRVSPFLWKYLYHNKSNSLSAGRCQTPALRLVYDNEMKKRNLDELEYKYKIVGQFSSRNIKFDLNHEFANETEAVAFLTKTREYKHKLSVGSPTDATRTPPKPFSTSRLLQTASNQLHLSPTDTMSICQQLYQTGYITYMRTESSQYSNIFLEQASKYITEQYGSATYIGDHSKLENKDVTNPHEAIRVTQLVNRSLPSEDKRMVALYKLIWRNTLESCMSDAKMQITKIEISAPDEYKYLNSIETPIFMGWKIVNDKSSEVTDQTADMGLIMYLKSISSSQVNYTKIESSVVVHNKHHHYTEASLIQTLEELGIGRPSTFATIVDTIQERGYVKKTDIDGVKTECREHVLTEKKIENITVERTFGNEKNKLVIEPIGILTVEFLTTYFDNLFAYEYTKTMESKLDLLSTGELTDPSVICKECYDEITQLSKPVKNISKQTYKIDDTHEFIFDKYGPVLRKTVDDENVTFISVRKDINIDVEKLSSGGYTVEELMEKKEKKLGVYENTDVILKNGRYGLYVECGERHETLKDIAKPFDDIVYDDVVAFLDKKPNDTTNTEMNVLRKLNDVMSVRKGKFGAYVYYKRPDMKSPQFLNIKKYSEGYLLGDANALIEWLCKTYNLPKP
jgi:DNA topoisomerase-1